MWTVLGQLFQRLRRREEPAKAPVTRGVSSKTELVVWPTVEEVEEAMRREPGLRNTYEPQPPPSKIDRWFGQFEERARQRGDEYHRKKIAEMLAEAGMEPLDRKDGD